MKPITKDLINQWKEAYSLSSSLEGQIIDRVNDVLYLIFSSFGVTDYNWYFEHAEEGDIGSLPHNFVEYGSLYSIIVTYSQLKKAKEMCILLQEDQQWDLSSGHFPTRWLFEDFEKELLDGKERYKNFLLEKEKKRIQKKSLNTDLAESAKAKLSKEELIALKKSFKK